jgi:hypothetical protein
MRQARRQISFTLALVMVISSLLNVVLVECLADADHHEIELIAHQIDTTQRPSHFDDSEGPTLDSHADGCEDSSLIADSATRRPAEKNFQTSNTGELVSILPALPPWIASPPDTRPPQFLGAQPSPTRRPAIEELAAIRLLI